MVDDRRTNLLLARNDYNMYARVRFGGAFMNESERSDTIKEWLPFFLHYLISPGTRLTQMVDPSQLYCEAMKGRLVE